MKEKLFLLLQRIVPQHLLSRLAGKFADSEVPWLKNFLIAQFARHYDINITEALPADYEKYPSFNAFFTRPLKPGVRPFDLDKHRVISPADGAVSEIGSIQDQRILQAKSRYYSVASLLGENQQWATTFSDGLFATVYLSPSDYHRVHMPVDGTLLETIYVPGQLFSVNQTTADNIDNLFARNERLICIFSTPVGSMAMILVGAMIVASIETVWSGQITPQPKEVTQQTFSSDIALRKGDEMGRFKLGSTVILLFEKQSLEWQKLLTPGTAIRLGESLGTAS